MKIKEYKIVSNEENGLFPQLECVAEHEIIYDDVYLYFYHDNYELVYMIFGDTLKIHNNYVEHYYIMAFDETDNPIGFMQLSSGGRTKTTISFDSMFTFLLLTGGKSFISIHNHPNNNSEKSYEDIENDNLINTLSKMLNINYKNGLIITKEIMEILHKNMYNFMKESIKEETVLSYEDWIKMEI